MPTIIEIIAAKNAAAIVLVPERKALDLLSLRNSRKNRDWLASILPHEIVAMPRHVRCYRHKALTELRDKLRSITRELPPAQ